MTASKGFRRPYTGVEIAQIRFYAKEGLSVSRTAKVMGRTLGSLRGTSHRYVIKFHAWEDVGAPFGNQNRKGKLMANPPNTELKKEAYRIFQRHPDAKTYILLPMFQAEKPPLKTLKRWRELYNGGKFEQYAPPSKSCFFGYDYGEHLKSGATYTITRVVRLPKSPYDGLKIVPKHDPEGWLEQHVKADLKN